MRKLTDHLLEGLNEHIEITVLDAPGQGGACHLYEIAIPMGDFGGKRKTIIHFQEGPINVAGVNGVSVEALLVIIIDRLAGFQSGEFATEDNADALQSCKNTLYSIQKRTLDRLSRGVEGTFQK